MIYFFLLLLCNTNILIYAKDKESDLLNKASDIFMLFTSPFTFILKIWQDIRYLFTDETNAALHNIADNVLPTTFIIFEPTEQELANQDHSLLLEPLDLIKDRRLDAKGLMNGLGIKILNSSRNYFMKPEGPAETIDLFPIQTHLSRKTYDFFDKVIRINANDLPMRSEFDKLAFNGTYSRNYCTYCGSTFIRPDPRPIISYKFVSIPVIPPPYTSRNKKIPTLYISSHVSPKVKPILMTNYTNIPIRFPSVFQPPIIKTKGIRRPQYL